MAFLDFYTIDLTSLVIILLVSFFTFTIINYIESNKDENYTFNAFLSFTIGILFSIFYSYITIEPDDILTTNFWE